MKERVVLVTGASRGIGSAIAKDAALKGYHVVGTATTESGAAKINNDLELFKGDCAGMVLDINNHENIEAVLADIKNKYSQGVDILINNAAITGDDLLLKMKRDKWDDVIATNLTAAYSITKAVMRPMLKSKWGRIINISSVVAVSGNPGQTNYCAAKAGLLGFTKSLAQELGSSTRNITVNAVAPGFIETDMTDELTDIQREHIFAKIPMARMGSAHEVASAVSFLASEESSYITGQTLHVNGGLLMV
ncbi:MAG: 3-oxoacyl-[acyl-carrier-protein] reductase [Legionellales bacterium]|nr:3-oxoacyl-[acyl-carrier-protein] reductase [Legionellales bacterium]